MALLMETEFGTLLLGDALVRFIRLLRLKAFQNAHLPHEDTWKPNLPERI